ncbi:MAG TPA: HEAT repeat domain-containing protein [Gemmatimonadaceae bacterium]|nr:HEAT repeat domain-containing protein [Gemmatimonadaceae bacterium]
MRAFHLVLAALGAALLAGGAAAQGTSTPAGAAAARDTSYEGRPLGSWIAQLRDPVPQARVRAAYVMAELGPAAAPAVPALRAALADENPVMRYAAAWALSEIGPAALPAVPDLEARADDDSIGDVRWIAAKALRKLHARPPAVGPQAMRRTPPGG